MGLSKKIFFVLKKILIVLLAMMLIVDLLLMVSVSTVKETVLNPDFIEEELDKLGVYSMIQRTIIKSVNASIVSDMVDAAIPEEMIRKQVHNVLGNVFGYLNSETDTLDMTISLIEIKKEILSHVPNPAFIGPVARNTFNKQIPDRLDLSDILKLGELGILAHLRMLIGYLMIFFYILAAAAIILVLSIILIERKIESITLTLGLSSLITGAISYGIPAIGVFLLSYLLRDAYILNFIPMNPLLIIIEDMLLPAKNYGIQMLTIGGILLIFPIVKIYKKRKEKKQEKTKEKMIEDKQKTKENILEDKETTEPMLEDKKTTEPMLEDKETTENMLEDRTEEFMLEDKQETKENMIE